MNYDKLISGPANRTEKGRFAPGHSGNPSGRPPKTLMQRRMEERYNDPEFVDKAIISIERTICSQGMAGVLERKHWSERIDGPVKQEFEVTGSISVLSQVIANRRKRVDEQPSDS